MRIHTYYHYTSDKGYKVRFDMTGAVVFFVALLSIPVIGLISGWGFITVMAMLIGMTGFVHFVASFFAGIYRWTQQEKADEERKDEK